MKIIIDFVPNHVARQYKSIAKPKDVEDLGEGDDTGKHFDPQNNFYYCRANSLTFLELLRILMLMVLRLIMSSQPSVLVTIVSILTLSRTTGMRPLS